MHFGNEIEENPSTNSELLVLDSLFPLVKHLTNLTKETSSGCYYVPGKIERSDLQFLYNDAGRVGELTLAAEPDSESRRLAPHVLARIAQLQDPNKPLFPLLHLLRVTATSPSLNFLHLFLSSALATLEMAAIPVDDPCYSSVLSFLECAIHQAPNLSTLILGPGRIPSQILDISSRHKNLRCLKLLDVRISITDQLLQDIGSLQHLEEFHFQDSGASKHERSPVIPPAAEHVIVPKKPQNDCNHIVLESDLEEPLPESPGLAATHGPSQSPSPSEWSRCSSPQPLADPKNELMDPINIEPPPIPTPTVDSRLFPVLKSLVIFGDFSFIEDLVAKVSSPDLRMLAIDFTKPLKLIHTSNENLRKAKADEISREAKEIDLLFGSGARLKKSKKTAPETVASPLQPIQLPQFSTAEIGSVMRRSIQKWINSLEVVVFANTHLPTTLSVPSDVFRDLLMRPDMERLVITGMGIDSVGSTLHRLKEVAGFKLKALHLPVHSTGPAISLARLRSIAEACPHLKSLHCRFKHLSNIPVSPPLMHQLEELSVANERAHSDEQRSFDIARYLNAIFPNLKSILTHDGEGNNAAQWRFIFKLVKLCQVARMDDKARALELGQ